MRWSTKYIARLAWLVVWLAGCGGGGGGGGGGGMSPSTRPLLRVTGANAYDAVWLTLSATETINIFGHNALVLVFDAYYNDVTDSIEPCSPSGTLTTQYTDNGDNAFSAGDVLTLTFSQCGSMTGQFRLAITHFEGDGVILVLEGDIDYDLNYGQEYRERGTQRLAFTSTPTETRWRHFNADIAIFYGSGFIDRLTDVEIDIRIGPDDVYQISLQGNIDDAFLNARYSYRTDVPFSGLDGDYPTEGLVAISGDASTIEFGSYPGDTSIVFYEIDLDGDGTHDSLLFRPWNDFIVGLLFNINPDNQAPVISSLSILPEQPLPGDDLVLVADVSDPDGDSLNILYEWYRNDILMPEVTGDTYPASGHTAGDTISVTLIVEDRKLQTTGNIHTTIQAIQLIVTALQEDVEATYGEVVTFQVALRNQRGNPIEDPPEIQYEIGYGPSGLTVDAVTGWVNWVSHGPMFDRETLFHWGIKTDDPSITPGAGTILVRDMGRQYPLMRSGLEKLVSQETLMLGDFDNDGREEMLIAHESALSEFRWDGTTYSQTWMYPFSFTASGGVIQAITTGDTDGDGHHEIFVCERDELLKLDGRERRIINRTPLNCFQLAFADLNGDGRPEIVIRSFSSGHWLLNVLTADTLDLVWSSPAINSPGFALGNVDTDATLEIVTPDGHAYDGATFVNEWAQESHLGFNMNVGDVDGDGIVEIVSTTTVFQNSTPIQTVRVYSPLSKTILTELIIPADAAAVHVADINDDSIAEILIGDANGITAYTYNSSNSTLEVISEVDTPGVTIAMKAGDIDGDGAYEIVAFRTIELGSIPRAETMIVVDPNNDMAIEFMNAEQPLRGPYVGGEIARSTFDPSVLLFARQDPNLQSSAKLLGFSPDSGTLTPGLNIGSYSDALSPFFPPTPVLAVSDYDGDGIDEAFIGTTLVSGSLGNLTNAAYIAATDFNAGHIEWDSILDGDSVVRAVATHDLTNDGHDDLLVVSVSLPLAEYVIYAYDMYNQTLLWKTPPQNSSGGVSYNVKAFDLDNDGVAEIVVSTRTRLSIYSAPEGPESYAESWFVTVTNGIGDLVIGDTDDDGEPEIFVLTQGNSILRYDRSLELQNSFILPTSDYVSSLYIENIGPGKKNLVVTGSAIVVTDSESGAEVSRSPRLVSSVEKNSLHYVDIAGDGNISISYGTGAGAAITR